MNAFFDKYFINPLFGDDVDGVIRNSGLKIPVEIKLRFPEIFPRLTDFFSKSVECIDVKPPFSLDINFTVEKINNFTTRDMDLCISEFKRYCPYILNLSRLAPYPTVHYCHIKHSSIEYSIEFAFRVIPDNTVSSEVAIYDNNEDFFVISSAMIMGRGQILVYELYARVLLTDSVKAYLSSVLIEECIRKAKNMPKNWGLLVIYTDKEILPILDFIDASIRKYLAKHPGLGILLTKSMVKDNEMVPASVSIWAGKKINESLQKSFFQPSLIKVV